METNIKKKIKVISKERIAIYRNWLLKILKSRRNEGFWTVRRVI